MAEPLRSDESYASSGASEQEVAARRAAMRRGGIQGGGEGDGVAAGQLKSVQGNEKSDAGMAGQAGGQANLNLLRGGKGGDDSGDGGGSGASVADFGRMITPSRSRFQNWARAFAFRNRRKLIAGGGGAGIVALLIAGFFALLPLKLETLIKNFWSHEAGRMEEYMEHRSQVIIYRYLFQKVTKTAAPDNIYVGSSILQTLYGNMQKIKFEEKLFKEMGIKIEADGPHGIRLTMADGEKFTANSPQELQKFMDTTLKGRQARKAIKIAVKKNTYWYQFIKRRHLRKYMINAYRIRHFSIKKKTEKTDPKVDPLDTDTGKNIRSNILEGPEELTLRSFGCVIGQNGCDDPDKRKNPDGSFKGSPPKPLSQQDSDVEAKKADAAEKTRVKLAEKYNELKELPVKTLISVLEKQGFSTALVTSISESVPVIGLIIMASHLDEFFWAGHLKQVAVQLHSGQYASAWATFWSLEDQHKAGQLDGTQNNIVNYLLENAEKSNAVQRIYYNSDTGVKLPEDKRVGNDISSLPQADDGGPCGALYWNSHQFDPPPYEDGAFSYDFWTWAYRQAASSPSTFPPTGIHTPLCSIHNVLGLLAKMIPDVLMDAIQSVLSAVLKVAPGFEQAMNAAMEALKWVAEIIWKPVVTGAERNEALANALDAGADVVANQTCRDVLGCKNIPYKEAQNQYKVITAQRQEDIRSQGVIASLFNTDVPEALGARLIASMPSTPQSAVDRVGTTALAMIGNPMNYFAGFARSLLPGANADSLIPLHLREPNGVQQTGYTSSEVDDIDLHLPTKDIAGPPGDDGTLTGPDGRVDQYDCPQEPDAKKSNICLLDVATAQAMCAAVTNNDDGGLGGHGDPGPCGDTDSPAVAWGDDTSLYDGPVDNTKSHSPFSLAAIGDYFSYVFSFFVNQPKTDL